MIKKMVIFVIGILFALSLASCNHNNDEKYLLKAASTESIESEYDVDELNAFLEKLDIFSAKLTHEVYKVENGNYCISPVSIYMALSIAIECANNETRDEMLNAVGVTYDEVKKFTNYLYCSLNKEYYYDNYLGNEKLASLIDLSNSIWIDNNFDVKVAKILAFTPEPRPSAKTIVVASLFLTISTLSPQSSSPT